jgi:hypothetical protein
VSPKDHCHVYKNPLLNPILSHMNLVNIVPLYSLKVDIIIIIIITTIIIISFTARSFKWSLLLVLLDSNIVFISYFSHACYMTLHLTFIYFVVVIIYGKLKR